MTDRLHCIEAGSSSLPVVVLLHGFGGCAAVWATVIDQIKHHARVLAFDLPGHAGSLAYPNFGSPRVAALAVVQDLKQCGIEKAHLVGHSMGGAIAALIALQDPEKVASLTLLAPGGFGAEINGQAMEAFAEAESRAELRTSYETMSGCFTDAVQQAASNAAAMRAQPGQLAALAHVLAKITRDGTQGQLPMNALAALQIPVHLLWGEQDRVVPVAQARAAPGQFRKTLLPDAGHMLIEEAPDAVVRSILEQL